MGSAAQQQDSLSVADGETCLHACMSTQVATVGPTTTFNFLMMRLEKEGLMLDWQVCLSLSLSLSLAGKSWCWGRAD